MGAGCLRKTPHLQRKLFRAGDEFLFLIAASMSLKTDYLPPSPEPDDSQECIIIQCSGEVFSLHIHKAFLGRARLWTVFAS